MTASGQDHQRAPHAGPTVLPVWQGLGATAIILASLILYGAWSGGVVARDALAHFSPHDIAQGLAYHRPLYVGAVAVLALEGLFLAWLLWHPSGRRLVQRLAGPVSAWAAAARVGAGVAVVLVILKSPMAYALEFVHQQRFDLLRASLDAWVTSYAVGGLLGAVTTAVSLGVLYALIARGGRWWLPAGLLLGLWLVGLSALRPVLVDPLFHEFQPLADSELRADIEELVRRAGLAEADIYVMDASSNTSRINAYVTGLGPTQRIVLYDTLITRLEPPEATFIVAHELAHRHHTHTGTHLAGLGAGGLLFMGLLAVLLGRRHHGGEAELAQASDPRGVPLVLLAVLLVSFLTTPAAHAWTRAMERQADQTALAWTGDPEAAATVHQTLAVTNLSDLAPHPVIYAFFFSHPTAIERLAAPEGAAAPGAPQTRTRQEDTAAGTVSSQGHMLPQRVQYLARGDPPPG